MNTALDVSFASYRNVFADRTLSLEDVRARAPAVFASGAHEDLSSRYTFVPSEKVLSGLISAGFVPVDARQARSYRGSGTHAQHVVRLRRRYESIALRGSAPEILFLKSHDGSSAYQLRMGLYRAVCCNGLIVSRGAFPTIYVAHRGDVVDQVVSGALKISGRFDRLAAQVERMEARHMHEDHQLQFAGRALALKYPDVTECGMVPAQLLTIRRREDTADDLYTVLNRCQENLLRGGLTRRVASGRLTRTRRVTSIRKDLTLNSRLWDLASEVLDAA
jgi:Domain of unknown function (DUF932)